jgi:hypothetical protein
LYKEAEHLQQFYQMNLNKKSWSLHLDGNLLSDKEHEVMVLKNEDQAIHLGGLILPYSKAETIDDELQNILTEYSLWSAMKMIVCDTTAVNTGRKSVIVVRLQNQFLHYGYQKPVHIGCQHHTLDRVLKHVTDHLFGDTSQSPNLNYPFVIHFIDN